MSTKKEQLFKAIEIFISKIKADLQNGIKTEKHLYGSQKKLIDGKRKFRLNLFKL